MLTRKAQAIWEGNLTEGHGTMAFGGGAFQGAFSFASRFKDGKGTNPEELIGAAHAGCFSMAFSNELAKAGFTPRKVSTTAKVHFDTDNASIATIDLITDAIVPGIDEEKFQEIAEGAKTNCPVSRALAGVEIQLKATLQQS